MSDIHDNQLVIIGIVRNAASWARVQQHQQYYVPIRLLSRVIDTRYIAFYMPAWHPHHAHHITHIAEVHEFNIQPRTNIWPEHATHPRATHLYVVFTLSPVVPLDMPIPSPHWRRVSVHRTTMAALTRMPYLGWSAPTRHTEVPHLTW